MKMMQKSKQSDNEGYLDGQLLVAMPLMTDRRFERSVIYVCAHSAEGAMGLIINKSASNISFADLLSKLEIGVQPDVDLMPSNVAALPIHVGGPVETGRGFVLHSSDYFADDSTLEIDKHMCLTATVDILRAIAEGDGPEQAILALGYAGWSAGQLEDEIQANGWLNCPADPDLVFQTGLPDKYSTALTRLGIDPLHLVADAGHA